MSYHLRLRTNAHMIRLICNGRKFRDCFKKNQCIQMFELSTRDGPDIMTTRQKRLRIHGTIADVPTLTGGPRFLDMVEVDLVSGLITATSDDNVDDQSSLDIEVINLPPHAVLIPGLVDCHIHGSQFPFHGTGLSRPLMADDGFLHGHAFPTEKCFQDPEFAKQVYPRVVQSLIDNGTTTAAYYGTIHRHGTLELAKTCVSKGQRAFVGMVQLDKMMDEEDINTMKCNGNGNADLTYMENTTDLCLRETERFLNDFEAAIDNQNCNSSPSLVQPILTPRFIPSCSQRLLEGLAEITKRTKTRLGIQTHIQESTDEVMMAEKEWNTAENSDNAVYESDLQVFRDCKLLAKKNDDESFLIAAHGVHIDVDQGVDQQILQDYSVGIAHCPLSNFYFADGVLDVMKLHAEKLRNFRNALSNLLFRTTHRLLQMNPL